MARQDVASNIPAPLAHADIGASLESAQTKALGQYLFWVLKSHQIDPANPAKIRFGGPTPNRLLNEYANEAAWKGRLGEDWLANMKQEVPLLAELKPAEGENLSFDAAATPPALLQHYRAFYDYIAPAFADNKISRSLLDQKMAQWATESIYLITLHLKHILTSELVEQVTTDLNKAYQLSYTSQKALYFIAAALHLAFSMEALTTYFTEIRDGTLRAYLDRFLTHLLPDANSYFDQALREINATDDYGLLNYTQSLYKNINSPEAKELRRIEFSFLADSTGVASSLGASFGEAEDNELVELITLAAQLLTQEEFVEFYSAIKNPETISQVVNQHKSALSEDAYIQFMARLILRNVDDPNTQSQILAQAPKSDRLRIYKAILKLAETAPVDEKLMAFEAQIIRSLVGLYLGYKNAINPNTEFTALASHQKAERNIAAAYEILALLESLQAYNQSEASEGDKSLAYKAVMNVVMHLRAEAEIRGKRGAQLGRQSSEFAKLLNFTIPGVEPVSVEKGKKSLAFPADFDLTAFNKIKVDHAAENTWFKRFGKKLNNWAAQNPLTIFAGVLSTLLMAAGVVALGFAIFSPAAPLIGALSMASLFIPGLAALIGGGFVAFATVANAYFTADAKIKTRLGELNIETRSSVPSDSVNQIPAISQLNERNLSLGSVSDDERVENQNKLSPSASGVSPKMSSVDQRVPNSDTKSSVAGREPTSITGEETTTPVVRRNP